MTRLKKRKVAVAAVVATLLLGACGGAGGEEGGGLKSTSSKGSTREAGKGQDGKAGGLRIVTQASDKPDELGVDGGADGDKPDEVAGRAGAGAEGKPDEVAGSSATAEGEGPKPGDSVDGAQPVAVGIASGIASTSGLTPAGPAGPK